MSGITPYLRVEKWRLKPLLGDPAAMFWFQAILDYSKRFMPDRHGYIRIVRQTIQDDYGLSREQIKYLNRKLVDKKLIALDPINRGYKTPTGYKIL